MCVSKCLLASQAECTSPKEPLSVEYRRRDRIGLIGDGVVNALAALLWAGDGNWEERELRLSHKALFLL